MLINTSKVGKVMSEGDSGDKGFLVCFVPSVEVEKTPIRCQFLSEATDRCSLSLDTLIFT